MLQLGSQPPQTALAKALPAPTGGLNDLDPLANMDPAFMIDGMNVFPDTGLVLCRPGYQIVQTGFGKPVKTILEYRGHDGSIQKFCATDDGIYEIATPGTKTLVKALTNGDLNYTQFSNAGNTYLVACNGVDPMVLYNGSTWVSFTEVTTPVAPGEIKGINPALVVDVYTHNARLWLVKKNSMEAYYMPVDAVGGEAKVFLVGSNFTRGGYLLKLMRWSSDTGAGIDDRLVFITTAGEIASYSGTDPATAETFQLDSVFMMAPPLGDRGLCEFGGDVLVLSRRGLMPASSLLYGTAVEQMEGGVLSRRINRKLQQLTAQWMALPFPIEVFVHSELQWITINVWDSDLNRPTQYVMNLLNGSWGRFNYPVRTLRTIDNITYMGTQDGRVLIVTKNGYRDELNIDGTAGLPIEGWMMGAYTYLDDPNSNKHAKLMQPVFQAEVKPSFRMRALPDFRTDPYNIVVPPSLALANAKWDLSYWDLANWAGLENVYRPWMSANVLGYAFAWQIKFSTSSALGLAAVKWVWAPGGLV